MIDMDTGKLDSAARGDRLLKQLSLLGYDSPAKLFEDFPQSQFSPGVKYVTDSQPPETVMGFPWTISLEVFSKLLMELVVVPLDAKFQMMQVLEQSLTGRLTETSDSGLALVPQDTCAGDYICVLSHCRFPVVLRKVGTSYVYLGGAFVYGLMDGEVSGMVKEGTIKMEELEIV
jgi:hypothetical protein